MEINEKLLMDLHRLVERWRITQGAYLNDFGDGYGECAEELNKLLKEYWQAGE